MQFDEKLVAQVKRDREIANKYGDWDRLMSDWRLEALTMRLHGHKGALWLGVSCESCWKPTGLCECKTHDREADIASASRVFGIRAEYDKAEAVL